MLSSVIWLDERAELCVMSQSEECTELRPQPTDEQLLLYAITHTPFTRTHTHTPFTHTHTNRRAFVSESLCVSSRNQDVVIIIIILIYLFHYIIIILHLGSGRGRADTEPIIERYYAFAKFINVWSASTIKIFKQTVLHSFPKCKII